MEQPLLPDKDWAPRGRIKTAIIGGGHGCRSILQLVKEGRLPSLKLEIVFVVDPNPASEGMVLAKELGISTASFMENGKSPMERALEFPGLDLVIELTGSDLILSQLYRMIPDGVKVMDHSIARVFWDLSGVERDLRKQLKEKIKLEEKLKKDQKRLQDIINSIGDAVVVMDRDLIIEAVNEEFTTITGIAKEEVLGGRCRGDACGRKGRETAENNSCPVVDVIHSQKPKRVLHCAYTQEGKESHYEVTATPLFDEEGHLIRVVETFHRITEMVQMKRETRESASRFQQFVDSAHDLIIMKDLEGRYTVINPRAAGLFGMTPKDFIGKTDRELFGDRMGEKFSRKDREVIESRKHLSHKEVLALGENRHYLDTFRFPLLDYKGDCKGVCSISRDVTQERRLQRSLIESEKFAALGKLAAGVAHEINNPLSGILSFAEDLLVDAAPDDPARQDYEVILREALRCRRIVRDLLDYARLQKPVRHPTHFDDIVRRVLVLFGKQAAFRNIEIDTVLSDGTEMVSIDSGKMQQVLLNLLINAADAMDGKGTIRIMTGYLNDSKEVFIRVSDHGAGIPQENLEKIFEPFFSTKGTKGNGLGLPVVASIVEQHGGKVDVETEMGKGTTFQIRLPAAASEEPGAET